MPRLKTEFQHIWNRSVKTSQMLSKNAASVNSCESSRAQELLVDLIDSVPAPTNGQTVTHIDGPFSAINSDSGFKAAASPSTIMGQGGPKNAPKTNDASIQSQTLPKNNPGPVHLVMANPGFELLVPQSQDTLLPKSVSSLAPTSNNNAEKKASAPLVDLLSIESNLWHANDFKAPTVVDDPLEDLLNLKDMSIEAPIPSPRHNIANNKNCVTIKPATNSQVLIGPTTINTNELDSIWSDNLASLSSLGKSLEPGTKQDNVKQTISPNDQFDGLF